MPLRINCPRTSDIDYCEAPRNTSRPLCIHGIGAKAEGANGSYGWRRTVPRLSPDDRAIRPCRLGALGFARQRRAVYGVILRGALVPSVRTLTSPADRPRVPYVWNSSLPWLSPARSHVRLGWRGMPTARCASSSTHPTTELPAPPFHRQTCSETTPRRR